jgi:hypothetical protein
VDTADQLPKLLQPLRRDLNCPPGAVFLGFKPANFLYARTALFQALPRLDEVLSYLGGGNGIGDLSMPSAALEQFSELLFKRDKLVPSIGFGGTPLFNVAQGTVQGAIASWTFGVGDAT